MTRHRPHRKSDENSGSRNRPKNKTSKRITPTPNALIISQIKVRTSLRDVTKAKTAKKATPRKRYFVFGPELQLGLYKKSKSPQAPVLAREQRLREHCGKENIDILVKNKAVAVPTRGKKARRPFTRLSDRRELPEPPSEHKVPGSDSPLNIQPGMD